MSELTEMEARLLMSVVVNDNGKESRKYQPLEVENNRVTYFPLNWTIVHYIDEHSPLFGLTEADFISSQIEWLVTIKGYNISQQPSMSMPKAPIHCRNLSGMRNIIFPIISGRMVSPFLIWTKLTSSR